MRQWPFTWLDYWKSFVIGSLTHSSTEIVFVIFCGEDIGPRQLGLERSENRADDRATLKSKDI